MPRIECLNEKELHAYHLGDLGGTALDDAADHLDHCAHCEAAIARFDCLTDALLGNLRAHLPAPCAHETISFEKAEDRAETRDPLPETRKHSRIGSPPGYEVLGVLGRGGMGVVYRARQVRLNRVVALKMVLAGPDATPEERSRFQFEAELIGQLTHPNIVQIHEAGQHEGQPFFALELVAGGTLAERLARGGPLPPREAAELVERLARAMHHAHLQGVVHRDLKPANVLLERDGSPKITDFGLGRRHADVGGLTADGAIVGTPAYMAPEQAVGGRVGPAADVYALGSILYECLTGRPPFTGDTALEIMAKVHDSAVPPLSTPGRKVPRDLTTVCLRCLEKNPAARYSSAETLAEDLRRYLSGEPVRARPVGPLLRAAKWARRRPAIAALSAALSLLMLAAFVVALYQREEALVQVHRETGLKDKAETLATTIQHTLEQNRKLTIGLAIDQGTALCQNGEIGRGLIAFVRGLALATEAGDADFERVARYNLANWSRSHIRLRARCTTTSWCNAAVFSSDERILLTGGYDKLAQVWDVATGEPLGEPLLHDRPVWSVDFGPGNLAVTGSGDEHSNEARVWNLQTRKLVKKMPLPFSVSKVAFQPGDRKTFLTVCLHEAQLWSSETLERVGKPMSLTSSAPDALDGNIFDACFSPDGSLILLSGSVGKKLPHESGEVRLYETATGKVKGTIFSKDKPFRRAVFSDDGLLMATASDTVAQIWSVATQQPVGAELNHTGSVTALAFSPDGRMLATGNVVRAREALTRSSPTVHGGQARLWDVPSGDPLTLPIAHPSGQIIALAFSPKGQLLLTGCIDGHARLFSTVTGDQVGNRMFNAGNVCVARFSRDGRLVLTAANGNSARLWEIPPEEGIAVNLPVDERVTALCYSADGTSLLCCADPGVARIWDPARREFRKAFAQGTGIHEAAFQPDGDLLLSRGNGVVQKWNATSAQLLAQWSSGEDDWHPKISPDRTRVAAYSAGQVHRTDVSTGRAVAPPFRVSGAKVGVDWDFDSNALFTTSKTGPVERRESSTGRVLSRLPAEVGSRFLAVSPDGRTLLTRGPDEALEPVQELLRDSRTWADCVVPLRADVVAGQLKGFELGLRHL